MQVSVETTAGLERRMTVALPAEEIDSEVTARLRKLSKTARLNGFRPGKVPFQVVKKRYEPQVRSEVLGNMINRSYYDAVQQEKLRPAGQPEISQAGEDTGDDEEIGFRFVATFEVYPDFEPRYDDSIKVTRPEVDIEDTDVDQMLESLRAQRTRYDLVERAAADGDQIVIDFEGRIDSELFDGGKAEKAPIVLGKGGMIPGFEEQLIGLSADEKRTIEVTFPEDYQAEHLAGKAASFDIHVHEVRESRLPEFDEDFVKSFGIEDGQLESLRADVRKNMDRELAQRIDARVKAQVMDGLVELNPIEVPSPLVKQEIDRQRERLMEQMPAEADTSMLRDELFREQAVKRVRLGLVVGEIVRSEGLEPDADSVRTQIEKIASTYEEPQQVVDYYYANQELLENVEGLVLEEMVTETVLARADVTDEPTSFDAIMNPKPAETDAAAGASAEETSDKEHPARDADENKHSASDEGSAA